MTNCIKCGNIIHEKTAFCPHCGYNRGLEYIVKICPKCLQEYAGDSMFCINDGSKLVDPEMLVPKCVKCNSSYEDSIKYCPHDGGEVIPEAYRTSSSFSSFDTSFIKDISKGIGGSVTITGTAYASFGKRALATLIDSIILFVIGLIIGLLLDESGIIGLLFGMSYKILFESSKYMGTPGKLFLKLAVVDIHGNRLSLGRSAVRYFASIISGIILGIGYLFPLFTAYKQTLHDMIAGCVVIQL